MKKQRKIACLNAISQKGLDLLTDNYSITDNADEAHGILVRSAKMHDLQFGKGLRCIARAGAGVNNIPLDRCAEEGIVVFNTPGANANAVKENVLAGLLLAARDIKGGMEWCDSQKDNDNVGKDMEKAKKNFAGHEIFGKKLGVIGLGAVGAEVANAAEALGMDVFGYDPFISVKSAWGLRRNIRHIDNVEEIYKECDYITVHVPALDNTIGMINRDAIAMMKDGVVILNFARDLLVNDDDMAEALASGKVAKYVTDFPNAKVNKMVNVIATPHLGASTEEAEDNCAEAAVQEMMDYLENGNIRNSVNFPMVDMGKCENAQRIALLHQNVPNMIGQITAILSGKGLNIANMLNKSRGKYAYTLVDLEEAADEATLDQLRNISGVARLRHIQ
ncbi:D-3-phosphoglycerate dehydrogenase [[Clostridium] aminophilum]|uniref:D-3-phosphoglycerate dehydrogenase n=1 Tax=[Clostridium] aminophilum TaxID=1526 RepID=A0A1I0FGE0_9FIRM|nr:phosphoglycerate dehydrogenase [[Clostridium] aminophilum]SET57266.1 D-3-phosphoglycerate dehydrogenase [[Clostridium] aminophilum]